MRVAVLHSPSMRIRAKLVDSIQRGSRFEKQLHLRRRVGERREQTAAVAAAGAGWTVLRLPLAAARCSGVALCMSGAPASCPASSRICFRA
jgi:hypothetical protein